MLILDRVGFGARELGSVDPSLWLPDPLLAVAASLLLLAAYVLSAALWGLVVRDLGGPSLPVLASFEVFMVAGLARYLPGKLWAIAGLATLAKGKGVPPATAAAAGVLGQGVALLAAAGIGLGALLSAPAPYRTWGARLAVLVSASLALALVPGVFDRLAGFWFRIARSEPPPARLSPSRAVRWLALYGANWALYGISFWVLVRSLGLEGGLVPVAASFAAAYVLGYAVVFAPAGLGPREGFLVAFLALHVGTAPAGVIALVARLWTTLVEVVPAALFWALHLARGRARTRREAKAGTRGGAP